MAELEEVMKNMRKQWDLQLLNKQIIDEREEGLVNKVGAATVRFSFPLAF